jgi:tRNA (guanine37-N1)-methyltransferase
MRIDIISVIPELIESPLGHSILHRAQDKGLLEVNLISLREYAYGNYKQLDDYAFGGGAGMVLMCEPIANCIRSLQDEVEYDEIIYMSPDGDTMDQPMLNKMSLCKNFLILCGHYKGVDQRIRDHFITKEISIGDYVLSGGELGAAIFVDAIGRLIPGVLSDETSALTDSFQDGLLAPPVYTRPREFENMKVPEVLFSGDTKRIEDWRYEKSLEITKSRRPDLLK